MIASLEMSDSSKYSSSPSCSSVMSPSSLSYGKEMHLSSLSVFPCVDSSSVFPLSISVFMLETVPPSAFDGEREKDSEVTDDDDADVKDDRLVEGLEVLTAIASW